MVFVVLCPILGVKDFTTFNEIVAPLLQELDAFLALLHKNPVLVMTKILFQQYFTKITNVVNELVSKRDSFSGSNSCLIQVISFITKQCSHAKMIFFIYHFVGKS